MKDALDEIELPSAGILVDRQILKAMELGMIAIDPFEVGNLEPATYDMRVGKTAVVSTSSAPIDLSEHPLLTIEPYAAAILHTVETLRLSDRYAGHVGPKTSLLRRGIIASTGPQIDPGFEGALLINLVNVSPRPFHIRYNETFVTIEFQALSLAPSRPYRGPYQGRTELTAEEINRLLAFSGPTLKDVHACFREAEPGLRAAASLADEIPSLVEGQEKMLQVVSEIARVPEPNLLPSTVVPITTFEPEQFELLKPIQVVVQPTGDGYMCTFFDANVNASGETQVEAVANLKSVILDTFEDLESEKKPLGPGPNQQLAVLRSFIKRR